MTPIINFFIITVLFASSISSFDVPLSYKYEMSIGYDDNFMRFSNFEIDSYDTQNRYLGDAKTYDSAILSNAIQLKLSSKLKTYQTNTILRLKHNYYSSSSSKSYSSFLGRFEFKLAPYSWIKLSYSLLPNYYLRTYIDRDLSSSDYHPCFFSNETAYVSYSHKIPIKKTWLDYRFVINNQFYNQNFTEYDSEIKGFEGTLKSKFIKSYYVTLTYLYYVSDNISYNSSSIPESTKMDRSYTEDGFKFNLKKTLKDKIISSLGFKFYFNQRVYDLNSWYYESDNWKVYSDYDLRLEVSKKINNIDTKISFRHFFREVSSSESDEIIWAEDYKNYSRNELWLKLGYNF